MHDEWKPYHGPITQTIHRDQMVGFDALARLIIYVACFVTFFVMFRGLIHLI